MGCYKISNGLVKYSRLGTTVAISCAFYFYSDVKIVLCKTPMQLLPASSLPSNTCYESAFVECRHSCKQKKSTGQSLHRHCKFCGKIFTNPSCCKHHFNVFHSKNFVTFNKLNISLVGALRQRMLRNRVLIFIALCESTALKEKVALRSILKVMLNKTIHPKSTNQKFTMVIQSENKRKVEQQA